MELETAGRITILLADDEPRVRRGLRMRLGREPDLVVVGEAETGGRAITLAQELMPDVVLLDVALPDQNGIDIAAQLRTLVPQSAVVMLSMYDDAETRARATAGAAAIVGKHEPITSLLTAIRNAALPM